MIDQVAENSRRNRFLVTAPGGQATFNLTFPLVKVVNQGDVEVSPVAVYVNGLKVTAFSWSIAQNTVTLNVPAASGDIVVIEGDMLIKRKSGYPLRAGLDSRLLNMDANNVIRSLQELRRDLDRTFRLNRGEADDVVTTFPLYQGGMLVGWDPVAKELVNAVSYSTLAALIPTAEQVAEDAADVAAGKVAAEAAALVAQNFAAETEADRQAVMEALNTAVGGPSTPKTQIITSGFTAGSSTSFTISDTPRPLNEESFTVYYYNGTTYLGTPAPDRYSYNGSTGVVSLSDAVPANTTKIVVKWWTSLNIGAPADNSVNWLTKVISAGVSKIAAWGVDGAAALLDFVTTIGGAPNDSQIPTAKAVKDYIQPLYAGRQLQRQITSSTEIPTVTGNTGVVVALGPSVAITPQVSNSLIRVKAHFVVGSLETGFVSYILYRDGAPLESAIGAEVGSRRRVTGVLAAATGNRPVSLDFEFDDFPGDTAAHSYELRFVSFFNNTLHLNKMPSDANNTGYMRGVSWIKAEEISQ